MTFFISKTNVAIFLYLSHLQKTNTKHHNSHATRSDTDSVGRWGSGLGHDAHGERQCRSPAVRSEPGRGDASTDQEGLLGAGELESAVQRSDRLLEKRGQWTDVPPRGARGQPWNRKANGRGSRVPPIRPQEALDWTGFPQRRRRGTPPPFTHPLPMKDLRMDRDFD